MDPAGTPLGGMFGSSVFLGLEGHRIGAFGGGLEFLGVFQKLKISPMFFQDREWSLLEDRRWVWGVWIWICDGFECGGTLLELLVHDFADF